MAVAQKALVVERFDLTYSEGPGGKHQMNICGEGLHITRSYLMTLAQQGGLDVKWAGIRLDAMLAVIDQWATLVESFDICRATRQKMHHDLIRQREALIR